jgi:hypothetical protein
VYQSWIDMYRGQTVSAKPREAQSLSGTGTCPSLVFAVL